MSAAELEQSATWPSRSPPRQTHVCLPRRAERRVSLRQRSAGAAHVFDYASDTLADEILECTHGNPVDRIVEVEFGKNAETNARVIAERGTIAAFGSALDMTPMLPFYPLMFKSVTIKLLLIYLLSPEQRERTIKDLTALLLQEALEFRISDKFDLADCAMAHDAIAAGGRAGSVILTI